MVRRFVNDPAGANPSESECRWVNSVIYGYLDDAQREMYRLRPDLFVASDGIGMETLDTISTSGSAFIVDAQYRDCLAYYAAYMALGEDSDDSANAARSNDYYEKFIGSLR